MSSHFGERQQRCPDCEALAAYVDHGLGNWERFRLERHLATCADCLGLIAGVVGVLSELTNAQCLVPRKGSL